jgi:hypothetical protein
MGNGQSIEGLVLTHQEETELTTDDIEINTTKRRQFHPQRVGSRRWRTFLKKKGNGPGTPVSVPRCAFLQSAILALGSMRLLSATLIFGPLR